MAFTPCLLFLHSIQSANAELPMIQEQPWLGYFAVAEDRA
jgi:hypothetical protein